MKQDAVYRLAKAMEKLAERMENLDRTAQRIEGRLRGLDAQIHAAKQAINGMPEHRSRGSRFQERARELFSASAAAPDWLVRMNAKQACRVFEEFNIEVSERTVRRRCEEMGINPRGITEMQIGELASAITGKQTRPGAENFLEKNC